MNIAIITIGNRDIKLKNREFPNPLKECRKNGKYILNNYSDLKDAIELPIIQPFWDVLNDRNEKINKLFLIATDQEDERYRNTDSINYAKVIKKHFERENIDLQIIALKNNVNDFVFNYNFFQNYFSILSLEKIEKFYLLPVGGMPNINTPLILTSILALKEKVFQYYVDKEQRNARPVPFNHKFIEELEKEKIKPILEKFFFATVESLSSKDFIKKISNYAYHRLSFNLKEAKIIIDDLILQYPNENLNLFSETITDIRNNLQAKIREIFFSAIVKIKQKQFADALTRLYNFTDNLLMGKVCEYYHLEYETGKNFDKWWRKASKKIKMEYPDIENQLEPINGNPADLNRPGIPLYSTLIKFKNKSDSVFEISQPLLAISDMRNKSIAAHGFEGISLEKMNEILLKFELNLNDLIKETETYIGFRFEESCYYRIADKIRNVLDKHTYSDEVGPRRNYF